MIAGDARGALIAGVALAVLAAGVTIIFLRRNERRLADEAERALPGPLDETPLTARRASQIAPTK